MIKPHGGKLINRVLSTKKVDDILYSNNSFCTLKIDLEKVKDVRNIARGVYSQCLI